MLKQNDLVFFGSDGGLYSSDGVNPPAPLFIKRPSATYRALPSKAAYCFRLPIEHALSDGFVIVESNFDMSQKPPINKK